MSHSQTDAPTDRQNEPVSGRVLLAIYDLDRTVTRLPTFTPFLLFAAKHSAPWRLIFLPIWLAALIGYKMKLYGRKGLKAFGIGLFVGQRFSDVKAARLADDFVASLQENEGFLPGSIAQIAADKAAGARLILLTAAPEFYAQKLADHLGFDACLATLHVREASDWFAKLAGENNYGSEKRLRIDAWLAAQKLSRAQCHIRFYSDHASDAPLFDYSDEAFFIGNARGGEQWQRLDWQ